MLKACRRLEVLVDSWSDSEADVFSSSRLTRHY